MNHDIMVRKIYDQLREDVFDKGQTVSMIAKAIDISIIDIQKIIDEDPDIGFIGSGENGEDLYISTLHLDREGYY